MFCSFVLTLLPVDSFPRGLCSCKTIIINLIQYPLQLFLKTNKCKRVSLGEVIAVYYFESALSSMILV